MTALHTRATSAGPSGGGPIGDVTGGGPIDDVTGGGPDRVFGRVTGRGPDRARGDLTGRGVDRARRRSGFVLALCCAVIWGAQFPVAKDAYAVIDVFHVNVVRYGIALLLLLVLLVWREGIVALRYDGRGRSAITVGVAGLCCSPLLVYSGLTLARPEIVAVIIATQPAMTALALWITRGQRPAAFTLGAIVVAFTGVVTIITGWRPTFLASGRELTGGLMVIAGCCSWVYYTLHLDRFAGWSTLRLSTLTTLPGTLALLLALVVARLAGWSSTPDASGWRAAAPALLFLGIVCVFVAMLMWTRAVRDIGSLNGMLLLNLIPVTTFAIGFIRGHGLQPVEAIGAALVLVALIANNVYLRIRARTLARRPLPTITR
ncbi:MAG: DMT family transporter [Burkholderiaceae bacterium]